MFLASDLVEWGAMSGALAVLYFSEINFVFECGNDIDFVNFSFIIMSNDGMIMGLEKINNSTFRSLTDSGGASRANPLLLGSIIDDGSFELIDDFADRAEALTVFGADAMLEESLSVGGGTVADVTFEMIPRIFMRQFNHVIIAGDFGDDGGSGNFFDEEIGFFEHGNFIAERSILEKVDSAVDDNFIKRNVFGEDLFDSATGAKLERVAKAIMIDFAAFDPAETGG